MKKILFSIAFIYAINISAQSLKVNYFPNGAKESEGILLCNDPKILDPNFGNYSKEEQSRILATTVRDGEWKFWYDNGQLRTTEVYKNGEKLSGSKSYYTDGKLESEIYYDGKLSITYYENGQKQTEGIFLKGDIPNGVWKGWHENGKINYEATYNNGVNIGITKWYDVKGKLYLQQEFTNGKLIKETSF
jgi:antitoxin component YwqK of YwqJK toxin-antitoxin module